MSTTIPKEVIYPDPRRDLVEKLKAARALLAKGWCQCSYANDKHGRQVGSYSHEAVEFCISGALGRVDGDIDLHRIVERVTEYSIPVYNDRPGRTQDEVLAVMDKAISSIRT